MIYNNFFNSRTTSPLVSICNAYICMTVVVGLLASMGLYEKSNFFTWFFGSPGGSNGVYTAIFQDAGRSRIAVIERGGELRWLKLE